MDNSDAFAVSPSTFLPLLVCGMISMVCVLLTHNSSAIDSDTATRLFGCLITQVFHYFDSRDNGDDNKTIKTTVSLEFLLQIQIDLVLR